MSFQLEVDRLLDYFSIFGPVQNVNIHYHGSEATSPFGYVKFEGVGAAENALEMKHHVIGGRGVEVEIAQNILNDERATSDALQIEPTNANSLTFMDLNDDCIREILTYLKVTDLCSLLELSQACGNMSLKEITKEIFRKRCKRYETGLNTATTSSNEVERQLAKFTSLISTLLTDECSDAARKIKSVIQWCNGMENMKWLHFEDLTFDENETMALNELFGIMNRLHIDNCRFEGDVADLFSACRSLDSLLISNEMSDKESVLQNTFPNLTRFFWQYENGTMNYNFENFISRHKELKSITLMSKDDHSGLLPIIASNCSDLIALEISSDGNRNPLEYQNSVKSIVELTNLNRLMIRGDRNAIKFIRQLQYLQSLKSLYLANVRCDYGMIKAVSRLTTLQYLDIENCDGFTNFRPLVKLGVLRKLNITSHKESVTIDLVYMISRLPLLEMLAIDSKNLFKVDEEKHKKIVEARVKSGSAKCTVYVCISTSETLWITFDL